jgi:glycerol-3-phosphate dehydrogenase subunit B
MLDLVVIGAGLSGMMAALTAARNGLTVRIVSKGLNALHWSAGTVDVLGYLPGSDDVAVSTPFSALDTLFTQAPGHPYQVVGAEKAKLALNAFQALTEVIGLPYVGASKMDENLTLPSPVGAARPVFLAPQGQIAGDLGRSEPILVVGFEGLRDFFPYLIAENLRRQGHEARAISLPLAMVTGRKDYNTIQLAHELEAGNRARELGRALRRARQNGERIGLPAILGDQDHERVLTTVRQEADAPIFEIPTLPPSVPGIRLFTRLREHLRQEGVRIEAGMEVIETGTTVPSNGSGRHVQWVASETSARPYRHHADRFLLATGGILGGGFTSDHTGRFWEVVFDLPLAKPERRNQWFRPSFLNAEGHPIFSAGVVVDDHMQPVDTEGTLVYENLWAAGNLLAASDAIQERSMEGIALATGFAAGEALSN